MIRIVLPDGTELELTHLTATPPSPSKSVYDPGLRSEVSRMWERAHNIATDGNGIAVMITPAFSATGERRWRVSIGRFGGDGADPNEAIRNALAAWGCDQ